MTSDRVMVPAAKVAEMVADRIAQEGIDSLLREAGCYNGHTRKQLRDGIGEFTLDKADRLLIAAGLLGRLGDLLGEVGVELCCADCGKVIEPGDYRPLTLWRVVPDAPEGKRARAGGRRARRYDLCRKCAGIALAKRGGGSIKENGKRRHLKTKERVAPGRAGRPRLFTDDEIRAAHRAYETGLSIPDLAKQISQTRGTYGGVAYALQAGFHRLGLPIRPKAERQALAHHRRGRIPKRQPTCTASKRNGEPCSAKAKSGHDRCVSHLRWPQEVAA